MYSIPTPAHDTLIRDLVGPLRGLCIKQIGRSRIPEFVRFAYDVFRLRLRHADNWKPTREELNECILEEVSYADHGIYGVVEHTSGKLVACTRGVRWAPGIKFVSERVFGISTVALARRYGIQPEKIFHGSYIALSAEGLRALGYSSWQERWVLPILLEHCLQAMQELGARLFIAETDPLIEARFRRLGVFWQPVSAFGSYMGQTRVAALDVVDLLSSGFSFVPESVRLVAYPGTSSSANR